MTEPPPPAAPAPAQPPAWRAAARSGARLVLAPALLYLLAFVVLTWPAVLDARTHVLADEGDGFNCIWNLWWLERAVREDQSIFHTEMLHHPFGISLRGQTLGLFNAVVALPFRDLLSREQLYNVLLVGSMVAAGVAAFLLAHRLTGSWPGSLAAGFVFTFSHWHMARALGHLNLVASEWLPVFALAWLALLDRPSILRAALAAAAIGLAGLCDMYFLAACAMTGALLLAGRALDEGWRWVVARERLLALASFSALAFVATAPLALPLAELNARDPLLFPTDPRQFSADLLGLVVPGVTWRFSELTKPLWERFPIADSANLSLGLPVVMLAVWVWLRRAEVAPAVRLRAWFLLVVVVVVLGLGPELQVAGRQTGVPLPWAAIDWFPPLKLAGKPSRLMVVATLGTAVVTAAGVQLLLAGGPARRRAAALLVVALLVDHLPRAWPTTRPTIPAYVHRLQAERDGAVLDTASGLTMPLYFQTLHEKPLAFGYIARYPTSVVAKEQPLIAAHARGDWRALRERFQLKWLVVAAGVEPLNPADLRLVVEDAGGRLFELAPR